MSTTFRVLLLLSLAAVISSQDLAQDEVDITLTSQHQDEPHLDEVPPSVNDAFVDEADESPDNKYDFIKIFAGLYYQNTYKQINDYLVDHLESADPHANLQLALDWLNDEKKRPNFFNRHFIEGLTQFTSLIKAENRCDRSGYAILLKNDRATNHVTHKSVKPTKLRRIESIVYHKALEHAINCLPVYPDRYREKLAILDADKVQRVENFLADIISHILLPKRIFLSKVDATQTIEATSNIKSIRDSKSDKLMFQLLEQMARNDPDSRYLGKVVNEKSGKLEVNNAKVELLYDRYFGEPCQYYVDELGAEIFVPASYDTLMFQLEDRYDPQDVTLSGFLLGWSRYRLCKLIVSKERNGLINDLIKLANKH